MCMGIDVGEASCQEARKCLDSLWENVTAELYCEDVQKIEVGNFEPFDIVLCINSLYFVTSLDTVLSNCLKLLKAKGKGYRWCNLNFTVFVILYYSR